MFKSLCRKAFKSEIEDFNGLSGEEQREICQEFFNQNETESDVLIIVNSLFPGPAGYMSDKFSDLDLGEKANKVINAFNLEISALNVVGPGPDLSCEFQPNSWRW